MNQGDVASWAASQDFLAFHATLQPKRLAALEMASGARWSYGALDERVGRCVTILASRGIVRGDRVAMLSRNCVDMIVVQIACARIGAIATVLNWRLKSAELSVILNDAAPALLIVDTSCSELADRSAATMPKMDMSELAAAIAAAVPTRCGPIDVDAPSIILYTSGTSGTPKGVMISERNAFHTGVNFCLTSQINRESALLCDAPLFHVMSLVIGLRACLYQGAAILISDSFDPAVTNERLCDPRLGVTHYLCVPQMAAALRAASNFDRSAVSKLTSIAIGGAASDPDTVVRWADDGIAYTNGYGMTEIGSGAGMPLDLDTIRKRPASVGLVPPTQRIRAMDPDGREVPPGTPGELWVQGPNVCLGYWNRPGETAQAFGADGSFKTGDIGVFDQDGYLTLVDRKKDMFISGGENVYPAEVELALLAHPDVREAAVVGISDTRWGEIGCAFVVLEDTASCRHEELRVHCAGRIAGYKIPRHFVALSALPRTGSGKPQKHILKTEFDDGRHQPLS